MEPNGGPLKIPDMLYLLVLPGRSPSILRVLICMRMYWKKLRAPRGPLSLTGLQVAERGRARSGAFDQKGSAIQIPTLPRGEESQKKVDVCHPGGRVTSRGKFSGPWQYTRHINVQTRWASLPGVLVVVMNKVELVCVGAACHVR